MVTALGELWVQTGMPGRHPGIHSLWGWSSCLASVLKLCTQVPSGFSRAYWHLTDLVNSWAKGQE